MPTEIDEAVNTVPGAAIEIISQNSRKKDLEISPPFYLKHGVMDVVVVDPKAKNVSWFTRSGRQDFVMGQTITLQCGCVLDV